MFGDSIVALGFWLMTAAISVAVLLGPIGRAIGRGTERIMGAFGSDQTIREKEETEQLLAERLEELDTLAHRLREVEERLEFAERLLVAPPRSDEEADTPPEAVPAAR